MDLTFFGLTSDLAPQARLALFNQIHQIVFHGNGGYDWYTVYNMPIWLRKYTFSQIKEHYDKENEAHNNAVNNNKNVAIDSNGVVKDKTLFQNQPKSSTPVKRPVSYK